MSNPFHQQLTRRRALTLAGGALAATAATATGVATASAATPWRNLVVVTANIGRARLDQRRAAIAAVRRSVVVDGIRPRPIVGWQEITEGDDDNKEIGWINDSFGPAYSNLFNNAAHRAHLVPISVPNTYKVLQKNNTFVHGGLKHVSPHRVISECVLQSVADPTVKFAFLNTHYVAGAHNGKKDYEEEWRDKNWAKHFDVQRARIKAYTDRGLPVIWSGDVNRTPMPRFFAREVRVWDKGIDQVGIISSTNGTQIRVRGTRVIDTNVDDHNARVAVLQIRHG